MPYAHLRLERIVASKQYRDGRFFNASGATVPWKGNPLLLMGDALVRGHQRTPGIDIPLECPLETWNLPTSSTGLRVTWLGHSTVLIETAGLRILTDPVFGERASPVGFAGPRRFHRVPVSLDQLPPLDAVLISHDHYDHFCKPTVVALAKKGVPFVTSLGVGAHLEACGVPTEKITELDWWERATIGGIEFVATPAQHASGRSLRDANKTLWSSWVIQSDRHRLFFSGDTGLMDEFAQIGRQYGPFDLTMLEIGAFNPAWSGIHLGPEGALRAFEMLGGGTLLPIHWATFDLALHPWAEPIEALMALAAVSGARVLTPTLGRAFEPRQIESAVAWWKNATPVMRARRRFAPPELVRGFSASAVAPLARAVDRPDGS